MRIWYQSAAAMERAGNYRTALEAHFRKVADSGTEVVLHGAPTGALGELQPAKVSGYPFVFHSIVRDFFLKNALQAAEEGYDAFVVGAFTEPALREIRSAVDIPVLSSLESGLLAACTVAHRFAVIAPTEEVGYFVKKSVAEHGLAERATHVETLSPQLADDELDAAFRTPDALLKRFSDNTRAVAGQIDAVIAGEGILAAIVAGAGLTSVDGISVLDPIAATVAHAEMQVKLWARTGLRTGRRWHFRQPPAEVMQALRNRS